MPSIWVSAPPGWFLMALKMAAAWLTLPPLELMRTLMRWAAGTAASWARKAVAETRGFRFLLPTD